MPSALYIVGNQQKCREGRKERRKGEGINIKIEVG
jgi:hypothetical protein